MRGHLIPITAGADPAYFLSEISAGLLPGEIHHTHSRKDLHQTPSLWAADKGVTGLIVAVDNYLL